MAFAFGHLIGGWIVGKIYEYFGNINIDRWSWMFLLGGSIAPDADFLVEWLFHIQFHRTLTHSFLGALIFFGVCYLTLAIVQKKEASTWSLFFLVGIFVHLLLDITTGIPLLYPLPFIIGPDIALPMSAMFKLVALDMGAGVLWLLWIHVRKGIPF